MPTSLSKELALLRDAATQTSEHTEKQLKSIDSNLPITLITLLANLGLTSYFKILAIYWIPTSFFLFSIWTIYSIFKNSLPVLRKGTIEDLGKAYDKYGSRTMNYGYKWIFEAALPLIKAIGVMFLVTFVGLLLIATGVIPTIDTIHLLYPMIISLCFILSVLPQGGAARFSGEGGFYNSYTSLEPIMHRKIVKIILKAISIIFPLLMIAIPLSALVLTIPLILPISNESLYVILVVFLQFLLIAVSGSFFSALSVKKELNNTITNLATITDQISGLLLTKTVTKEKIEKLKQQYNSAKIYDLKVVDFKLLNYYSLEMRKVYLEKLLEDKKGEDS